MTNPKSVKLRIGYCVAAVLALILFNLSIIPKKKTAVQSEFDEFVSTIEPKLHNPALTDTPLPVLVIKADAPERSLHMQLSIGPGSDRTGSEKVVRILEMAKEANLFSMANREPGEIQFVIETEKKAFRAAFNSADIDRNSQALAMLKLLQIYSQTDFAPAAPSETPVP